MPVRGGANAAKGDDSEMNGENVDVDEFDDDDMDDDDDDMDDSGSMPESENETKKSAERRK